MEFIILVVVILALIGSLSLAIPSKKSRKISKVRLDSKLLGCKISSTRSEERRVGKECER